MLMTRPNDDSTTVAPCSWAMRAHPKAIDASVSTPVTSTRLPARMPLTSLLEADPAGAGDRYDCATDVRRGVGGQPRDDASDLLRLSHPRKRHIAEDVGAPLFAQDRRHVCVDQSGRDDVGCDPAAGVLLGDRAGQA